jgi:hypothetical protein
MRLAMIANRTCRDLDLAKRCLNRLYVNHLTKLNRKSEANNRYSSADFKEAKKWFDNGGPQLDKGMDSKAMGLKWYRKLVMPLSYYPAMDDRNHANILHTISLALLPANHYIPVPPPSPD